MEYADKILKCEKCGEDFVFPCGEQKFFTEKEFAEPKKCPKCRGKENVSRPNLNNFTTTCPECNKNFNISFDPKDTKVLCFDCFTKKDKPQRL